MLGAGVSWALLPPADGAGVPRAPDPHSRETWAAGLRLRTGARLRRQQVCVGRWGREHEGCSPGVTETVLLSCWPGSGPGAGSSQPLAVCGPRFPGPGLGAPGWEVLSGVRVCVSLLHCLLPVPHRLVVCVPSPQPSRGGAGRLSGRPASCGGAGRLSRHWALPSCGDCNLRVTRLFPGLQAFLLTTRDLSWASGPAGSVP